MGCDIHIWTEKQVDGRWTPADDLTGDESEYGRKYAEIYEGRNYALFAMLAGVRNGYDIVPVRPPKGLPVDLSPEVEADMWVEHTPSWLTLAELKAYDWEQWFEREVWMNYPQHVEYVTTGSARAWCGGVYGAGIRKISTDEMNALIADPVALCRPSDGVDLSNVYAPRKWRETYREAAGNFYTEVLPRLEALADGDPTSVRIVFYFDS